MFTRIYGPVSLHILFVDRVKLHHKTSLGNFYDHISLTKNLKALNSCYFSFFTPTLEDGHNKSLFQGSQETETHVRNEKMLMDHNKREDQFISIISRKDQTVRVIIL